jgi:hypothetical protein
MNQYRIQRCRRRRLLFVGVPGLEQSVVSFLAVAGIRLFANCLVLRGDS